MTVTFGIDTFGDVTVDAAGERLSDAQVIRNVVEEAVLAERVGLDHVSIGEHHRDDFAVSAPDVILAAIASRTERVTLGTLDTRDLGVVVSPAFGDTDVLGMNFLSRLGSWRVEGTSTPSGPFVPWASTRTKACCG